MWRVLWTAPGGPRAGAVSSFGRELILKAMADSFRKLSPRLQFRNPVMFVVFVCSVLTTLLWAQALAGHGEAPTGFIFWVSLWLWFTLLFANFAEALAEGRGKAQANALRSSRKDVIAKKLASALPRRCHHLHAVERIAYRQLRAGRGE